jgi:hypothetical protein
LGERVALGGGVEVWEQLIEEEYVGVRGHDSHAKWEEG